jgi:hypothetical protein
MPRSVHHFTHQRDGGMMGLSLLPGWARLASVDALLLSRVCGIRCGQVDSEDAMAVLLAAEAAVAALHVLASPQMPRQVSCAACPNYAHLQHCLCACQPFSIRWLPRQLLYERACKVM